MNRIDRLFAILLQMQKQGRLRAQDIANQFGISKRTVYRDIAALHEMGVPIVSLPAEGYELMPGYFLPPLLFTEDEASAVFWGTQMLVQQTTGRLVDAAENALNKIDTAPPKITRQRVSQLSNVIEFYGEQKGFDLDDARLVQLQTAIQNRQVIWIKYFGYFLEDWTEREVEPDSLTYSDGRWYVGGYCRLRQERRSFRLERIDQLQLREETFEPRPTIEPIQAQLEVIIQFERSNARWVTERQHYSVIDEKLAGKYLVCTYSVHNLREIVPWLLSWGATAEPIQPQALRDEIQKEIEKLKKKLT
ncbi:MAG: YafY family protein [Chloroflexota bacterium]